MSYFLSYAATAREIEYRPQGEMVSVTRYCYGRPSGNTLVLNRDEARRHYREALEHGYAKGPLSVAKWSHASR